MDVYAASEEGLGLAYIQALTSVTGGAILLYPSLTDAALPQVCHHYNLIMESITTSDGSMCVPCAVQSVLVSLGVTHLLCMAVLQLRCQLFALIMCSRQLQGHSCLACYNPM